jgi:hypothetical protein
MYDSGTESRLNSTKTNQGGYLSTDVGKTYVDSLYANLADADLKKSIKKVTITCNSGKFNAAGIDDNGVSTYTTDAYMFLASAKEVGMSVYGSQYDAEGSVFDYFSAGTSTVFPNFTTLINTSNAWWLRSAASDNAYFFYIGSVLGGTVANNARAALEVVPAFVIG